MKVFTAARRY